ncbi:MAG: oligoribonuclease [Formosimonas sp.]
MTENLPPRDDNRLIWLDMEMTGLNPLADRILELAIVITDADLNTVAEAPVWVVHQSDDVLNGMDAWNQKTHGESGLIAKVKASSLSEEQVQAEALEFIKRYIGPQKSPMCGNSIGQDRRFMANYMSELERHFHYRNIDVSTLKELARRWHPAIYDGFKKQTRHTALADVYESIDELKYYRERLIVQ